MSDPQKFPAFDEMAALHAAGLLDDDGVNKLLDAARTDPEVARLVRDYSETAALLALEPPEKTPPPELRAQIFRQLPRQNKKILAFSPWFPYAVAACLMMLGIGQTVEVFRLNDAIRSLQGQYAAIQSDDARLHGSMAMTSLRIAMLEAKDPTFSGSKIIVAWDPYQHQGAISFDGLPPAPAGHDYQLWVLDPNAPAPISVGTVSANRPFNSPPVSVQNPGFAITLEPAGGSPQPTTPILFAVAPGA